MTSKQPQEHVEQPPSSPGVEAAGTQGGTPPEPAQEPQGPAKGNAEAAKYRTQLRETEAVTEGLREKVAALQRREVDRLSEGAGLAVAGDLFSVGGVELEALLDEDGELDAELVGEAVTNLLTERPGLHKGAKQVFPNTGQGRLGESVEPPAGGWATAIEKARGRG